MSQSKSMPTSTSTAATASVTTSVASTIDEKKYVPTYPEKNKKPAKEIEVLLESLLKQGREIVAKRSAGTLTPDDQEAAKNIQNDIQNCLKAKQKLGW